MRDDAHLGCAEDALRCSSFAILLLARRYLALDRGTQGLHRGR